MLTGMPLLTNAHVSANNLSMLNEIRRERTVELAFERFRRDDLRRWKMAETVLPQAIRGVKFVGTEYQSRYPDLQVGSDIQVDAIGFIVAEPASARQFFQSIILILFLCNKFNYQTEALFKTQVGRSIGNVNTINSVAALK